MSVRSATGGAYDVEIRDLLGRDNSCGCVDHQVSGLGTCKHIEGVLVALKKKLGIDSYRGVIPAVYQVSHKKRARRQAARAEPSRRLIVTVNV